MTAGKEARVPPAHDLDLERVVLARFTAEPRWSLAGLKVKLHDHDPCAIEGALVGLLLEGLLVRDGAQTWLLAPCVRHLDALGLLALVPSGNVPARVDAATIDRVLARRALEAYAQRRMADRDTTIIGELAPLIDRARRAGLDRNTIARCIGQPTLEGA
jgi:hypothetical protein